MDYKEGKRIARKQPLISSMAKPPEADDLKLINGVGPAVEDHLHRVGIFTFAQLAKLSPADIAAAVADISGLSAERIIKQNWTGQAHKLATESASAKPTPVDPVHEPALQSIPTEMQQTGIDVTNSTELQPGIKESHLSNRPIAHKSTGLRMARDVSTERLQKATFTVELMLDGHDEVMNTYIKHMQSGDEENWASWQESQLVEFLVSRANLKQRPAEIAIQAIEEQPALEGKEDTSSAPVAAESEPPAPTPPMRSLANLLHMGKPYIVLSDTLAAEDILSSDQPYEVHFTLHFTGTLPSPIGMLNYTASAYGRTPDQWIRHPIGSVQGSIHSMEEAIVTIKGAPLPEGVYWLEAETLVSLPSALRENSPDGEPLIVKGRLFEIY